MSKLNALKFKTIKGKIIISFMIIIIITILLSYMSISGMNQIEKQYGAVIDKNNPVTEYVWRIQSKNLEQTAALRGYILYKDEKCPKLFKEIEGEIDNLYKSIENLIETQDSQVYLDKIKDEQNQYRLVANDVFSLVKEENIQLAIDRAKNGRVNVDKIKGITVEWSTFVSKINQEIDEHISKDIDTTILINLLIIGAAIIISIALALLLIRNIAKPISNVTDILLKVSDGDLRVDDVNVGTHDEIKILATCVNEMVHYLKSTINKVNDASSQVAASAQQLTVSAEESTKATEQLANLAVDTAEGSSKQLENINESLVTVQQFATGITDITKNTKVMDQVAQNATKESEKGSVIANTVATQMNEINEFVAEISSIIKNLENKSMNIGNVVKVITDISEQTNLLALNATIEAAHAGEQGLGFAVVADEVRKLAEQSKESSNEIAKTIKSIQDETNEAGNSIKKGIEKVKDGLQGAQSANETFNTINDVALEVLSKVGEVSTSVEQMNAGSDKIVTMIENIKTIAEKVAFSSQESSAANQEQLASMEEISSSAQTLSELADQLQEHIITFKL